MSARPPKIPKIERPEPQADDTLEQLEETTLDKQAKSAAYRAVVEHSQHLQALNTRIDVLQAKLDRREDALHAAIPRVSELEQAQKTSRVESIVEAIGTGVGGVFLSLAPFATTEPPKYLFLGLGVSSLAFAVLAKVLFAAFGWPKKRAIRDY